MPKKHDKPGFVVVRSKVAREAWFQTGGGSHGGSSKQQNRRQRRTLKRQLRKDESYEN